LTISRSLYREKKLLSFRNGSVQFDLTWKEKRLNKTYGTPRNAAKLADDVYRALIEGNLTPKRFRIHGKETSRTVNTVMTFGKLTFPEFFKVH
jgi:hypothetical protein